MADGPEYRRILLKLSGESLCLSGSFAVDSEAIGKVAAELADVVDLGVQLGIVVGGGNFIRGRQLTDDPHIQRTTADSMGMLATVINALALCDTLNGRGTPAVVLSAVPMPTVCEAFTHRQAMKHLNKGRVVIFAGGTGNPFFTTDTCASLRACEINADVLIKATKVDGVFDSDPMKNPDAKRYEHLTCRKALDDRLGVMDLSAISMCMENDIPILVLQVTKAGNLLAAASGKTVGTLVENEPGVQ